MNAESHGGVGLPILRRLLAESERDLVALSREEADRIIAIPDRDTRLRAYLRLRESWSVGGDKLLPEDEARIQESLAGPASQREVPPPPAAPKLPLTPLSLLAWTEGWRYLLIESALRRGTEMGRPVGLADLEKILVQGEAQASLAIPEIGVLRQVDALLAELREGLEAHQLMPNEAISGRPGNLPGLLKVVAIARARRQIAVPPVPLSPQQRVPVADLLAWFEALMTFEEAVGARALMQAGVAREPEEARARLMTAARGNLPDADGHAGPQIASWRRAESMHRACSAALRAGWLRRERVVTIPSFDADELELWFGHFAGGLPALAPPPSPATPHAAYGWWIGRRSHLLRSTALNLLADGGLRASDEIEAAAHALIESRPSIFPGEWGLLRDAVRVTTVCEQVLRDGRIVPPLQDCTDVEGLVRSWSAAIATPQRVSPRTLHDLPEAAPVQARQSVAAAAEPPAVVAAPEQALLPPLASRATDANAAAASVPSSPAVQGALVPPAPSAEPARASTKPAMPWRQRAVAAVRRAADAIGTGAAAAIAAAACVLAYQAAAVGVAAFEGGSTAAVNEMIVRSSRITDWRWMGLGVAALGALLLLLFDAGRLLRPRRWRLPQFAKVAMATAVLIGASLLQPPPRIVATGDGFAAWPERIVQRGGVPTSTINPNEGSWFRRRAVEPLRADDLPGVPAGEPDLVLLREVGLFGRTLGWFVANKPDIEALAGRPAAEFPAAPSITLRAGIVP